MAVISKTEEISPSKGILSPKSSRADAEFDSAGICGADRIAARLG